MFFLTNHGPEKPSNSGAERWKCGERNNDFDNLGRRKPNSRLQFLLVYSINCISQRECGKTHTCTERNNGNGFLVATTKLWNLPIVP